MTTTDQITEAVHQWKAVALHLMGLLHTSEVEMTEFAVDIAPVDHVHLLRNGSVIVVSVGMPVTEGMGS